MICNKHDVIACFHSDVNVFFNNLCLTYGSLFPFKIKQHQAIAKCLYKQKTKMFGNCLAALLVVEFLY